ncbi:MAG: carbon storage regulator [Gemmataceae bacterium]
MLVLTRKTNEEIIIGHDIRITIVEVAPGRVKIGITAPRHVKVDRAEIHELKKAEQETVVAQVPPLVNRIAEKLPPADTPTVVGTQPAPLPGAIGGVRPVTRRKPR